MVDEGVCRERVLAPKITCFALDLKQSPLSLTAATQHLLAIRDHSSNDGCIFEFNNVFQILILIPIPVTGDQDTF